MSPAQKTLSSIEVTPQDFAKDYNNGMKYWQRHTELFRNFGDGALTPARYANMLGYTRLEHPSKYTVAFHRAQGWLAKRYPAVISALVKLHLSGLMPGKNGYKFNPSEDAGVDLGELGSFTSENLHFELMAFLTSLIYWAGTMKAVKQHSNDTRKNAFLVIREIPDYDNTIKPLIEALDKFGWGSSFDMPRVDAGRDVFYDDGLLSSHITRLLSLMGGHVGRKKGSETALPEVVELALATLDSEQELSGGGTISTETGEGVAGNEPLEKTGSLAGGGIPEKDLAYHILRDFVLLFFIARCNKSESRNYSGSLGIHKSQEVAQIRAESFLEAMEAVGFGHLRCSLGHVQQTNLATIPSGPFYSSIVQFPKLTEPELERFRFETRGRVAQLVGRLR